MTDEVDDRPTYRGSDYRVKAEHPRRGGPLVITDETGRVIGTSGDGCESCSSDELESMIRNGYVERVDEVAEVTEVPEVVDTPEPPKTTVVRRRKTDR